MHLRNNGPSEQCTFGILLRPLHTHVHMCLHFGTKQLVALVLFHFTDSTYLQINEGGATYSNQPPPPYPDQQQYNQAPVSNPQLVCQFSHYLVVVCQFSHYLVVVCRFSHYLVVVNA